jgi:hypothetical protein
MEATATGEAGTLSDYDVRPLLHQARSVLQHWPCSSSSSTCMCHTVAMSTAQHWLGTMRICMHDRQLHAGHRCQCGMR